MSALAAQLPPHAGAGAGGARVDAVRIVGDDASEAQFAGIREGSLSWRSADPSMTVEEVASKPSPST